MPNDGRSIVYGAREPGIVSTYTKDQPYQRPSTATESLAVERLKKRRARAIRNGRKYKI